MMVVVGVARSRVHKDTLLSPSTLKNYGVECMQVSVTFLLHSMSICSQKNDDIMMPNGCLVLHFDVSQGHPAGPKHAA
jgi:hypothetical protein